MTSSHDPAELAHRIQRIEDIEAIKQTKYKYFRFFDTANVEELAEILTEDITLSVVGGVYGFTLEGRDAYLEMVRNGAHAEMVTQHNGHHPEISFVSDTEAKAIWYLHDFVLDFRRQQHITGTAFYRDTLLKQDGTWKIHRSEFERIYEISEPIEKRPNLTFHYLATHGHKLPPGEVKPFSRED
jgi:hypothetical protein